jgi:hypothetical protein
MLIGLNMKRKSTNWSIKCQGAKMKKCGLILTALCLLSVSSFGTPSLTTVTATLQDSSTQVWANATWTAEFSPQPGYNGPYNNHGSPITPNSTGTADGSGFFTVNLDDNLQVSPIGSSWKFTICPFASVASCNSLVMQVTGASQDISSQLNAILTVPHVNSGPVIARAYNDSEAFGTYGALYINSISNTLKQCPQLSCAGSGWVSVSGGGGAVTSVFGRTGAVVATNGDYTVSQITGAAPLASPTFTGVPAAPTASPGTNTTQLATTAFVIANAGGGNVSNSGTPLNHQVATWTDATHIQGITPGTSGFVLTSNGASVDPSFQAPSGGSSGVPAQSGTKHFLTFNNSTTLSASSGNNWPGGLWSHLGGAFSVGSNVAGANAPAYFRSATNTGTAGASSSIAEDAVAQQGNIGIFGAYACYCRIGFTSSQIVWMGMSSILYNNLVAINPNGTLFAFRWAQGTDTNWQAYVSTAAATFTATDTGVAADSSFHQFGIVKNGSGGLDYYIDGTKVVTIASGATGFPGSTNTYAVLETGLLANDTDVTLDFNEVRWWAKF